MFKSTLTVAGLFLLTFSFANGETYTGDAGDNVHTGTNGADQIDGRGGDDTLNGGGGNDTIDGGTGDDTIDGGRGNDDIDGGNGNDGIDGRDGNDEVDGGNGNDTITGGNGKDVLNGGDGGDAISGGQGNDTIDGGDGNDPQLDGDQGNDEINGGNGDDTVDGGPGDDTIYGGPGDDDIDGGPGHDKIRGGPGDDEIDGGGGNDRIAPGAGLDTYNVGPNNGKDRISISAGDVPFGQVEVIKCGCGRDSVKFWGTGFQPAPPGADGRPRIKDPDTGGFYAVDPDCENTAINSDLKFTDSVLVPDTTYALAGTQVGVSGTGYPPEATVLISFNDEVISEFITGESGEFQTSYVIPKLPPGTYRVTFSSAEFELEEFMFFTVGPESDYSK